MREWASNRTQRTAHGTFTCCRCRALIAAGESYVRDHGRPAHDDCVRKGIRPVVAGRTGAEPPRYAQDDHVGRGCPGCGFPMTADDDVVHVVAVPWHADCRRGWRR